MKNIISKYSNGELYWINIGEDVYNIGTNQPIQKIKVEIVDND